MTKNKRMWKSSGRDVHKFLMKEAFRKLQSEGFEVSLESRVGKGIIDVLGKKKNKKIGIECVVRPTLDFVNNKLKLYSKDLDKIIFCYPTEYNPNFPIEGMAKVMLIKLPEYLSRITFIKNNKTSKKSLEKLEKLRKDNPEKIICLVTLSTIGQKRVTIPQDSDIEIDDYVEVEKHE